MLACRVIPCLDVHAGRVVKGVNFVGLRDAGDPVAVAERYDAQGADELVLLDITASHEGRDTLLDVVRAVADRCFMPFTVGGGIRTTDDAHAIISAGAEKVSLNTAAVVDPDVVSKCARRFGRCATVVNVDPRRTPAEAFAQRRAKRHAEGLWVGPGVDDLARAGMWLDRVRPEDHAGELPEDPEGAYVFEVCTHGGRKPTGLDAVSYAERAAELGAGEIVLTSMDADGTQSGFDLELTGLVSRAVGVPVVASGGCGSPWHMVEAVRQADADAVLAASIFHDAIYTVGQAQQALRDAGLAARPPVGPA
ncbi:MAG: imidazole glycerol phosphate synthase subunit HisF [Planctomycetota bacterium]